MSRWEPNARGRLEEAALDLYTERGFDETTVAEIAERAGLTERTFFRHFADKREVLFGGQDALLELFAAGVVDAPASMSPIDAVGAALMAVGPFFEDRHKHARRRQAVIAANPRLQERELIKLSAIASALADGLIRRGVAGSAANLTAEAGVAVFKVAFDRWITGGRRHQLPHFIRESLDELKVMAAGG
jgi:AcrR family transcriptional regulator